MIHCIICANSRPQYLRQVIDSLIEYHADIPYSVVNDSNHEGMAANVQHGFDEFLTTDADYCLWLEDDMVLLKQLPLDAAVTVLESNPRLAQMCFRREPWWGSPPEMQLGDQLAAITQQANMSASTPTHTEHDFLFSLNPCLIPRRIIELGWPAGELGIGNESGMTRKLLNLHYVFGSWGQPYDGQVWARHIGEQRGEGWRL